MKSIDVNFVFEIWKRSLSSLQRPTVVHALLTVKRIRKRVITLSEYLQDLIFPSQQMQRATFMPDILEHGTISRTDCYRFSY